MDPSQFTLEEELAVIDRVTKHGKLQAMDRVQIVGLTTEKGQLNGRIGTVRAVNDGPHDGRSNPYVAHMPNGRYKIDIEFEETIGKEVRPGYFTSVPETKTVALKRENLLMHDIGYGTLGRDPEAQAILRRRGINVSSTAEREAECPETAGFFPAILQGDETRAREILQYLKDEGSCIKPMHGPKKSKSRVARNFPPPLNTSEP